MSVGVIGLTVLIAWVSYASFKPEPPPAYTIATVQKGDIQATFDTQGIVESDSTEVFTAASGVKVERVDVAVGDRVTAGQQLALFDVSTLEDELSGLRSAYLKSKESYDKASKTVSTAKSELVRIEKEQAALSAEIAALEQDIAAAEQAQESKPQLPQYSEEALEALAQQLQNGGMSAEQIQEILEALKAQGDKTDVETALQNSLAAKKARLAQAQAMQATLKTQKSLNEAQSDETVSELYRNLTERKKAEYEEYKSLVETLRDGWTASEDGVVTEVNLTAGQVFTPVAASGKTMDFSALMEMASGNSDVLADLNEILSASNGANASSGTGIVIEYSGEFYASFTVGKYDLLDLQVGQKARITSADREYTGSVSYVSATASSTAGLNITSITSSLTGGASSAANSAPVKVKIDNPDERVIIGFDVDVSIDTEKLENVMLIPVEAVASLDGENCVFVYNEKEKTVSKRAVKLGIGSDTAYEVLEGLQVGEQIVLNPKTSLLDGDKIQVK